MKKIAFLLFFALAISLSSYAQNLPLQPERYDGVEIIDGNKTIRIYDFGAKIDANGKLYFIISYEHIDKNKDVYDVIFFIRILTKDSDMKNKKYRYCLFRSSDCDICKPEYETWIGVGDPNQYVDYEDPSEAPSWEIVGVKPDDIIGIQLSGISITYNDENKSNYVLSGFPKNSKIRRSDSDNLEKGEGNIDETQSSVSSNYANKTQNEKKEEIKQWLQGTWEWSGRIHIYGSRYDNVSMKIVVKGNNITAYGNGRVQDQGNIKSIDPFKGRITFGEYSYLDFDYNTRKQVLYTGKREEGACYKKTSSPAPKKTSNNSTQNVWQW